MSGNDILIRAHGLKKYFPIRKGVLKRVAGHIKAVDNVDLHIYQGETLGLVGESGCGKTAVGRSLIRLTEPTSGEIVFRSRKLAGPGREYVDVDVADASRHTLKRLRQEMQIVYQDP